MGLFGKKKPGPETCPKCGERLFLENKDGTRTCVKCGTVIREKIGGPIRYAAEEKGGGVSSAKKAICPNCGSEGEYVNSLPDGSELYRCSFCGATFEKAPKKGEPAPEAPKAPEAPRALDGREVFAKAKANTVEVHASTGNRGGAGTGFFIAPGCLLTNAHVVCDIEKEKWKLEEKVSINYKGGKRYPAQVMIYDQTQDMALLKTQMPCEKVAGISVEPPETGERIYAVGNTKGEGMCILEGVVADQVRIINDLPFMMISANTWHGNSGGPIFNDQGLVVGILTLGDHEVVSMNYAIPVGRIGDFLEACKAEIAKHN